MLGYHSFDNGHTASVIDNGYGSQYGLFEVAHMVRGTIIEVEGWLNDAGAAEELERIAALPSITKGA